MYVNSGVNFRTPKRVPSLVDTPQDMRVSTFGVQTNSPKVVTKGLSTSAKQQQSSTPSQDWYLRGYLDQKN